MSIVCDKLLQGLGRGAAQGRSLPSLLWREEDREGVACPFFFSEPFPIIPFWIWHAVLFPLLHPFGWARGHGSACREPPEGSLLSKCWKITAPSEEASIWLRSIHEEFKNTHKKTLPYGCFSISTSVIWKAHWFVSKHLLTKTTHSPLTKTLMVPKWSPLKNIK